MFVVYEQLFPFFFLFSPTPPLRDGITRWLPTLWAYVQKNGCLVKDSSSMPPNIAISRFHIFLSHSSSPLRPIYTHTPTPEDNEQETLPVMDLISKAKWFLTVHSTYMTTVLCRVHLISWYLFLFLHYIKIFHQTSAIFLCTRSYSTFPNSPSILLITLLYITTW